MDHGTDHSLIIFKPPGFDIRSRMTGVNFLQLSSVTHNISGSMIIGLKKEAEACSNTTAYACTHPHGTCLGYHNMIIRHIKS